MISDRVYTLCTSNLSISAELAKAPKEPPGEVAKSLFDTHHLQVVGAPGPKERKRATVEDLQRAQKCGKFGAAQPSELFLRAFNDVLGTLEDDPLASCVSPSLIGTTGVIPFAVIGPLNDIIRHMSNLIVRAKKEVLLATNYWMASGASQLITDALLELSRRAVQRGQMVTVRIMYDRGNAKQLLDNHQIVSEEERTGPNVRLPKARDLPYIDLQVVNFHRPLLGTFHSKFMIVDRQIGIVQSNNIQDNDNVEMMSQVEGPIVDSLWEVFCVSWHANIGPLPCAAETAASKPVPTFHEQSFSQIFTPEGLFRLPHPRLWNNGSPAHVGGDPHYDDDVVGEMRRMQSMLSPQTETETQADVVARHLNLPTKLKVKATAPAPTSSALQFFPFIPLAPHESVPIAIVSRKPFGSPNHTSLHVPQNEAFLSLIQNATRSIFIQTPDLNASPLYEAILAAVRRGIQVTYYVCLGYNDAGELLPGQNGTNEMFANSLFKALEKDHGSVGIESAMERLQVHYYVAKDQISPIHNKFKQRSCHIKLMIVDDCVAVQGSGNQDTQSWWQSQEVNIMVDSPIICKSWREGIERNQNTGASPHALAGSAGEQSPSGPPAGAVSLDGQAALDAGTYADARVGAAVSDMSFEQKDGKTSRKAYGRADDDGCWRDAQGKMAEGSLGVDPGKFAWAKGMVGAYKRATGAGGF